MFLVGEGFLDEIERGAADQFEKHIHIRVTCHLENIPGKGNTGQITILVFAAAAHLDHAEFTVGLARHLFGIAANEVEDPGTHGTQTAYADLYRIHISLPWPLRSPRRS